MLEFSQASATDEFDDPRGGPSSLVFPVADRSSVGEARRAAAALALRAGLDDTERGALAVVVTEATTNLAHHAREGVIVLRPLGAPGAGGVEALALDKGPGIRDLSRAMADGFSTGGTAGKGLGAIRRMASEFDLFSSLSGGTALLARVWSRGAARSATAARDSTGVVCVPLANDRACGDGWAITQMTGRTLVVLVDGLGHGREAAKAADEALQVVRDIAEPSPVRIIEAAHGVLRATRGAALAVADVRYAEGHVHFAGIGNISASVVTSTGSQSMASHNGTVGHVLRKMQEFSYPWAPGACLVMHSDGIMTRWHPDQYPGLLSHHPALFAGVLFRDFNRGRDDVTVLAVRAPGE